jgi:ferredoxin
MVARVRLIVDWISCDAHGMCAELLPEFIGRDDWGYPVVRDGPIPQRLEKLAERAKAACPVLALSISEDEAGR